MPKLQLVHELPPSFLRCHVHLGELSFRKETVTGRTGASLLAMRPGVGPGLTIRARHGFPW